LHLTRVPVLCKIINYDSFLRLPSLFSNSSTVELTLLIARYKSNISVPLFNVTKLNESDFELLQKVLIKTVAESITDFLSTYHYDWIIDAIRNGIEKLL